MTKKISKTKAVILVLKDGIRDIYEGTKLIKSIVGDNYSEDDIEKELKKIIKGLSQVDLSLSKNLLKYRLVEEKNRIYIVEFDKETYAEIVKSKKDYNKKKRLKKMNNEISLYDDDDDIKKQQKLINEILIIRKIINYWSPSDDEAIKKLKSFNLNTLEQHKNNLISKNVRLKSRIHSELEKIV